MPITIRVTDDNGFTAWVAQAKQKFAGEETAPPTALAAAGAPQK